MTRRASWLTLSAILILALGLRLVGIDFGLPLHLYPDESTQIETARHMLNGDLNPHFFRYSSLFMDQLFVMDSALEIFSSLTGITFSPSVYYLLGRLLSASYGTLTVWAVFLLGRAATNNGVGLIGAFLTAIAPEHVRESHYATVDVAMVFWAVLAIGLAVVAIRKKPNLYFASAICAGLALGTKYSAAIIVLPLLGLLLWMVARDDTPSLKWIRPRALAALLASVGALILLALFFLPTATILELLRQWTTLGVIQIEYLRLFEFVRVVGWIVGFAILGAGLGGLWVSHLQRAVTVLFSPQILLFLVLIFTAFFVTSPFILLDLPSAARDIFYEYRHALIGAAAQLQPTDPLYEALHSADFFPQPTFYFEMWLSQNGWVMTTVAFVGAGFLVRKNLPVSLLVCSTIALGLFALTHSANKAERYALLLVPILAFCVGMGFWRTSMTIRKYGSVFLLPVFLFVFFVPIQATAIIVYREFILPDTRTVAFQWLEQNAEPGALVVREANTPDLENASSRLRVILFQSVFEQNSLQSWKDMGARYILVSTLRDWYRTHADTYPMIAENYNLLEAHGRLVHTFTAGASTSGPPIWIYELP